jgi:hypothetical protein
MYPANSYSIRQELSAMPFPLDPNAPGGPGRSEYVRRSVVASGSRAAARSRDADVAIRLADNLFSLDGPAVVAEVDGEPVAALGLRHGDVLADPDRATPGILALMHARRLEARLIMSVFGA